MRLRRTLALAAIATGLSIAPTSADAAPHSPIPHTAPAAPAAQTVPTTQTPSRPWTWPLTPPPGARRPTIVHAFRPPAKRWQSGHRGVDLLGAPGQDVLAAGAGTVSYAGSLFGRPVVAIDHSVPGRDTLRTTYEPVESVVRVGDRVRAGQVIGRLADSPANHCAPRTCLHWGLVRGFGHGDRYLDPSALLLRGPVRLLPVWGLR